MTEEDIPYGYCECGCGNQAPISPYSNRLQGYVRGEPRRFIVGHTSRGRRRLPPLASGVDWVAEDHGFHTPCWTWQRPLNRKGYGTAWSYRLRKAHPAHRVAWEEKNGPFPDGLQADHLCRNRACVNPDHLEPVTPLINSRRRIDAKLTDDDRREILRLVRAGETHRAIARQFGVDGRVIANVIRRPPQEMA